MVVEHKQQKTYELTHEACDLIERLSKQLGIARQGVVEMAVRAYAESELATETTPQETR